MPKKTQGTSGPKYDQASFGFSFQSLPSIDFNYLKGYDQYR